MEALQPPMIRTYDEMQAMYDRREAEGIEPPYIVELLRGEQPVTR